MILLKYSAELWSWS